MHKERAFWARVTTQHLRSDARGTYIGIRICIRVSTRDMRPNRTWSLHDQCEPIDRNGALVRKHHFESHRRYHGFDARKAACRAASARALCCSQ